jgi:hypothetical protein
MRRLLQIVVASAALLFVLVSAKLLLEDRCAPLTSGIHGALQERDVQVFLLGSSHTRQGYDIAELERLTGSKDFAVAYDGLDLAGMVPLVRALMPVWERRTPHGSRLLVVEAYSANLARAPELQEPRLFFDAPPRTKLEIARNYLQQHPHQAGAWRDLWVLAANRGTEIIVTYPFLHALMERLSYHGGYEGKTVAGFPAGFSRMRVPVAGEAPNEYQLAALTAIIAMAKQHGVTVLLVDPPMPASVEAEPRIRALQAQFRRLAAEQAVPFTEGAENFPTDDPALFADSNHLSTAGREIYTQRFAAVLNGFLHSSAASLGVH